MDSPLFYTVFRIRLMASCMARLRRHWEGGMETVFALLVIWGLGIAMMLDAG